MIELRVQLTHETYSHYCPARQLGLDAAMEVEYLRVIFIDETTIKQEVGFDDSGRTEDLSGCLCPTSQLCHSSCSIWCVKSPRQAEIPVKAVHEHCEPAFVHYRKSGILSCRMEFDAFRNSETNNAKPWGASAQVVRIPTANIRSSRGSGFAC